MGQKVTFDPSTYTIYVTAAPVDGVVSIDVQVDLYSDGKEDWAGDPELIKFPFPLRSVGGDPLPGSKELGRTYFLSPPWKIKPYDADHTMRVIGNFYMEDGSPPFVSTDGTFTVAIESQVSNLVDSTVTQLEESVTEKIFQEADAAGVSLSDALLAMRRMLENKVTKSGDIITIYEEDGTSVWRHYNLSNEGRVPA